jgi:hypothetical protein
MSIGYDCNKQVLIEGLEAISRLKKHIYIYKQAAVQYGRNPVYRQMSEHIRRQTGFFFFL